MERKWHKIEDILSLTAQIAGILYCLWHISIATSSNSCWRCLNSSLDYQEVDLSGSMPYDSVFLNYMPRSSKRGVVADLECSAQIHCYTWLLIIYFLPLCSTSTTVTHM
ncbi:hypothetical protein FEM48_Zijuj09G0158500 [Ziziphus jujuba var. spinosa]|uniref:Uncharacterized protein n=1 Tax=Ziziphus jujuba var. spinosa TaxID=714518 RepID=A0A978UTW6_ZIZJJ|nr:hypothetical protein FEM48_Zijuj09G0158500 [Ziziphus jujuba var. spinosa]